MVCVYVRERGGSHSVKHYIFPLSLKKDGVEFLEVLCMFKLLGKEFYHFLQGYRSLQKCLISVIRGEVNHLETIDCCVRSYTQPFLTGLTTARVRT